MHKQFSEGKRYDVEKNYLSILDEMEIDKEEFLELWKSEAIKAETLRTFEKARKYAEAYPTLDLEHETGFRILKKGVFEASEVLNYLNQEEGNSSSSSYCKLD